MAGKKRLDILLVDRDFFRTRSKAKRAIMAGEIIVNGEMIDKAGSKVDCDAKINIRGKKLRYVSRGGLKLEKALNVFTIDPYGKTALDIGASTGGFTDCLLQKGARKVYAIDVGYGQLAWKLRQDERVEVIERTNFRYLKYEDLPVRVPLVVTDVSFISLKHIIPGVIQFLKPDGDFIALIKPQFEAGPEKVGKNGVVKDMEVHKEVLIDIIKYSAEYNLFLAGLDYSPVTGASSKNIEFLMYTKLENDNKDYLLPEKKIDCVVKKAHKELIK